MLEIGKVLQDRFLIEQRIGVGGMGAVYLATDQKFGSRVAIKQTIYDNPELAQAFEREARLLNSLHHPVLPHVSDIFSEDGGLLLVMEYIEGEDLSELLKRGEKLPIDSVVQWTFELLDALDYLHSQQPPIIHRDIKPNNLKLTPRGNVVLLDFGLAKETSGNTLGMQSVYGYSRRYSPLEQIEGTGTDPRSDIASLGATIFHLMTGEPPIDVLARASAIVAGRPDPLKLATEINPQVPMEFAALIKAAMSLNADDRFATAEAMRTAMEQSIGSDLVPEEIRHDTPAAAAVAVAGPYDTQPLSADAATPPIEAAPVADNSLRKGPRKRWTPPTPDVARAAAAAAVSAAASGRLKFRAYKQTAWRKPALVSLVLLALAGLTFGIYRAIPATAGSPQVAEASPVLLDNASAAGHVAITPGDGEYQLADENGDLAITEAPAAVDRPVVEKPVKNQPVAATKRNEPEPEPAPVVRSPEPERPRIVKVPKQKDRQPSYNDQPPVVSIERIFTGRVPGANQGRRDDISPEDRELRRRIRRAIRRGERPPF